MNKENNNIVDCKKVKINKIIETTKNIEICFFLTPKQTRQNVLYTPIDMPNNCLRKLVYFY